MELRLNSEPGAFGDGSCVELPLEPGGGGGGAPEAEGDFEGGDGAATASVWHDGCGYASGWLLEEIVVQEVATGAWWRFSCSGWVLGGRDNARPLTRAGSGVGELAAAQRAFSAALPVLRRINTGGPAPPPPSQRAEDARLRAAELAAAPTQPAQPPQGEAGGEGGCRQQEAVQRKQRKEGGEEEGGEVAEAPLDEVELQHRGSPRCARSRSLSRSRSSSPTRLSSAGGPLECGGLSASAGEGDPYPQQQFCGLPAGAAAPPEGSACGQEPRGAPQPLALRRVSGTSQPAVLRMVPLAAFSRSTDEGEGGEDGDCCGAGARASPARAGAASPLEPAAGAAVASLSLSAAEAPRGGGAAAAAAAAAARKGVRFGQFAEQLEFDAGGRGGSDDGGSSVVSFTEEQLLEAQGGDELTTYGSELAWGGGAGLDSYQRLAAGGGGSGPGGGGPGGGAGQQQDAEQQQQLQQQHRGGEQQADLGAAGGGGGGVAAWEPVALSEAAAALRPASKAAEYRLRVITGDRLSGGLAAGQRVHIQLLGAGGAVLAAHELPRARGSFARGGAEAFSLTGPRLGAIAALAVWHEPGGAALGGGWCCEAVELEDRHQGHVYRFVNPAKEGWLYRGRQNAITLEPQVSRLDDEGEALALQVGELRRQLESNPDLSGEERAGIAERLARLDARPPRGAQAGAARPPQREWRSASSG
ncbi:MAG: hypothetical protein J3K34DRAFT_273351 [Monoraphidium minutum]|nr:MAG: hypothetical protein J3K34DRAFT_273351 [Monoraphidium minutum]